MPIKTVIFDLDGTITEPVLDFDEIRRQMGLSADAGGILEIMEKAPPQQRRRLEKILLEHELRAVRESRLNKGVKQLLAKLRRAGVRIGLLTRNSRENAEAVLKKHDIAFDTIVARDDGPVKPDAFGVLEICRRLGTSPAEAIVVGDYLHDMLCAKAAGAKAVLLKTHSRCEKFIKEADFAVSRLDELAEIIDNMP